MVDCQPADKKLTSAFSYIAHKMDSYKYLINNQSTEKNIIPYRRS